MNKEYNSYLKDNYYLIEGAFAIVKKLSKQYSLYIVTNGDDQTQIERIQFSGLAPFLKNVLFQKE